jgi:hypothetical protein
MVTMLVRGIVGFAISVAIATSAAGQTVTPLTPVNSPMTFVLSPGREKIFAEGRFELDTPKVFEEFVSHNGLEISTTPVTVIFNSPGGRLLGGEELGTKIRSFSFNTAVGFATGGSSAVEPGLCASACAIISARGLLDAFSLGELHLV